MGAPAFRTSLRVCSAAGRRLGQSDALPSKSFSQRSAHCPRRRRPMLITAAVQLAAQARWTRRAGCCTWTNDPRCSRGLVPVARALHSVCAGRLRWTVRHDAQRGSPVSSCCSPARGLVHAQMPPTRHPAPRRAGGWKRWMSRWVWRLRRIADGADVQVTSTLTPAAPGRVGDGSALVGLVGDPVRFRSIERLHHRRNGRRCERGA